MRAVPQPDLRPLQQPLSRERLREAREWRRRVRPGTDAAVLPLRVAGWCLLLAGGLMLAGATEDGLHDVALVVLGGAMASGGVALLGWAQVRIWGGKRRDARLLAFAAANGLAYGTHVLTDPKPGTLFRLGLMREAAWMLRAPDGAEMGVWELRMTPRGGTERWGYLELPVRPMPGRVLGIALRDGRPPVGSALRRAAELAFAQTDQAHRPAGRARGPHFELTMLDDARATDRLPTGLLELLHESGRRLDVEVIADRLVVMQRRGWDLTDPALQTLLHRIRSLVAASGGQPEGAPHGRPQLDARQAVSSTAAGRKQRMRSLGTVLLTVCATVAGAFIVAWGRTLV